MNHYLVFVYGVCFALIGGAAFAMMWANIMSIDMKPKPQIKSKHPEAPEAGEEVMYVDLSREKLEDLYKDK
jgi:hypothetical protein|tara:strand:+ start:145 stop:357 length:213 start_codon:yes stop_codon:yes gene_type:complete